MTTPAKTAARNRWIMFPVLLVVGVGSTQWLQHQATLDLRANTYTINAFLFLAMLGAVGMSLCFCVAIAFAHVLNAMDERKKAEEASDKDPGKTETKAHPYRVMSIVGDGNTQTAGDITGDSCPDPSCGHSTMIVGRWRLEGRDMSNLSVKTDGDGITIEMPTGKIRVRTT